MATSRPWAARTLEVWILAVDINLGTKCNPGQEARYSQRAHRWDLGTHSLAQQQFPSVQLPISGACPSMPPALSPGLP